ncbi:MAG TPA: tyrosinase family protein [Acidimicrobiia bacterium]|jgi:tyrosinase
MAIRYRRNINCLTSDQLHDFREALQALYDLPEADGDSFATLGGLHGLPSPSWCDHGTPGFLTWHRAYMRAFEKALQCVNKDVMLPFWDWSSGPTIGVPAAFRDATYVNRDGDTVPNPAYSGPIASAAGGGTTNRRPDIDTTSFAGSATSAHSALTSATFASFQSAINGPHGSVHVTMGGHMGSVPRAGFDPIFYLHHSNVDRLWWNWQQAHPGAGLPASEAVYPLDPFNKPFSSDWYLGADMESTDDLGYRYANWCLLIPPIKIWDLVSVRLVDPWIGRQLQRARLVLRSSRMPSESVEFRVFVNQPRATHRTKIEDNASFAGSIGTFGMGGVSHHAEDAKQTGHHRHDEAPALETRSASTSFDLEINLTEHVRQALAEDAEELKLKIVALTGDGEPVDADRLDLDDIELILE